MVQCPNCYRMNSDYDVLCECGYRLKSKIDRDEVRYYNYKHNEDASSNKIKAKIEFTCMICQYKRILFPLYDYDAFICQNCHSIFSYNKVGNEYQISIVKKEIVIPELVKIALSNFELRAENITLDELKNKYREYISKFHPDKVSHLGYEFQILAEEKTKEANRNYQLILEWIKTTKT